MWFLNDLERIQEVGHCLSTGIAVFTGVGRHCCLLILQHTAASAGQVSPLGDILPFSLRGVNKFILEWKLFHAVVTLVGEAQGDVAHLGFSFMNL